MAEWIGALSTLGAALIALVAAWLGLKTFRNQRVVSDVQLALGIFSEINRYWDRLSQDVGSYDYNMGQILAQFEVASALFNKNVLAEKANSILGDHIVEVFCQIRASSSGQLLIERCRSADTTFSELQRFILKRKPQALDAIELSIPSTTS